MFILEKSKVIRAYCRPLILAGSLALFFSPFHGLGKSTNVFIGSETKWNNITVQGKVLDEDGFPLIGATIAVKGTKVKTLTNEKGEFSLKDIADDAVLIVSYVGGNPAEYPVTGRMMTIKYVFKDNTLNQIVVVGYGTQKKSKITGAISSVGSEVFENRPLTNVTQGLQASIPNLNIIPNNGSPNVAPAINIRGTMSINGGSPLVLVDGVEMNMNLINPNDIQNVTVLKDAASAAIYGVRGAFGVILITTKTGANTDKTTIAYTNNFGFSRPSVFPEITKTNYEHAEFVNKALQNAGLADLFSAGEISRMKAWTADRSLPEYVIEAGNYVFNGYNNWIDMLVDNYAPSQRHNLSLSGGNAKTKFFSSIGYNNQQGILKVNPDIYSRLNTRLNIENTPYDWLKIGFTTLFNSNKFDEPYQYAGNTWNQFVFASPLRRNKWEGNSAYPEYDKYIGMYFNDQNPLALLDKAGRVISRNNDLWNNAKADFTLSKNWRAHADFNYNINWDENTAHRKAFTMLGGNFVPGEGPTTPNSYQVSNYKRNYYSLNLYTEYEQTFNKHYLKGMLGYNQELTRYRSQVVSRTSLLNQELPTLSLGTGEQKVAETGYEWALRGGFFRLNYAYDDKYLLELNGRYDGTSIFPKDKRFAFFPSFSAGWRLSKENFMNWLQPVVNDFKIRGSYGTLGNQLLNSSSWSGNIKYYPYIPFLSSSFSNNYVFGSNTELVIEPSTLVSNSLTWEKASTIDIGADLAMFKSRLSMGFDWYQRTTSNMLMSKEYPELLGASSPVENLASLRTRGWEFSLNWRAQKNDFNYALGLILSDSQAEITKFYNPTGTLTNFYVGQKLGEIWGYTTEGFYQYDADVTSHASQTNIASAWAPGDIMYKDLDGDNKITVGDNTIYNSGDRRVIGNNTPRYNYGFNGSVGYKGFELSAFVQGVGKRDFWPRDQAFWPVATQFFSTQEWFLKESWTEDHRDAYFPRPVARSTKNQQVQTRYLQNAAYLRLKNLTLAYNFKKTWLNKIRMSGLQVYASGENLFFISKVKGAYDPEAAGGSGAMLYPFQRIYSLGLSCTF
ncbi:TonB-dependent receptor [Pedobacter sp. MC2016-24]|uniref:SusC/RagA family TonB-linked outer membrane protein n=1 Tax=Pedobacter sp. MC2016-24 TaxID=2780090 RepID=UPI0018810156|nr:TonB-dependent receptor [Pedobacter sp. MC2016-24]MBE9598421.1 TonB-dependent receptor [Pedobacter sp. MC2016-24]